MLSPFWTQPSLGSFLRGQKDARLYHNLFRCPPEEITGVRRLWHRSFSKVSLFRGIEDYLQPLKGQQQFLLQRLRGMTRPIWLDRVQAASVGSIGVHIRRGDLSHIPTVAPLPWFIQTLKKIRQSARSEVPAFVVSDGRPEELREFLQLPGVQYVFTGSAISDLLLLSQARVLLASGGSTFSAWAAFLGQMPAAAPPKHPLDYYGSVYGEGAGREFYPERPDPVFLQAALGVLSEPI